MLTGKEVVTIGNDIRGLLKSLEQQGCVIVHTKKNHYKVFLEGEWLTTLPGTPSDWRSLRNCTAPLKRAGLRL